MFGNEVKNIKNNLSIKKAAGMWAQVFEYNERFKVP
jgi:hypothetical protein